MKKLTESLLLVIISCYIFFFLDVDGGLFRHLRRDSPLFYASLSVFIALVISLFLSSIYWKEIRELSLIDVIVLILCIVILFLIENVPKISIKLPERKKILKIKGYVSCKEDIYVKTPFKCVIATKNRAYYIDKVLEEGYYEVVGELLKIEACRCILPDIGIEIITTEDKCKINGKKGICAEKVWLEYIVVKEYKKI